MPDIDIDFDDEGRGRVMDYVINKYGSNQVAQIVTYGTMAAKSSIRDTARVLDLPLGDADRIAKLVPNMSKLNKIFGEDEKVLKQKFRAEDMELINQLLNISEGDDLEAETVNQAKVLEGSLEKYRNSRLWGHHYPWGYYQLCSNSYSKRFGIVCHTV
jgi:DNA polymerase-3 subunit alpha